jgi:hypothetical protein
VPPEPTFSTRCDTLIAILAVADPNEASNEVGNFSPCNFVSNASDVAAWHQVHGFPREARFVEHARVFAANDEARRRLLVDPSGAALRWLESLWASVKVASVRPLQRLERQRRGSGPR